MKICNYRHCDKEIGEKSNKKYCCRGHKDMENTYIKRKRDLLKKYFLEEKKRIDLIREIQKLNFL